MAKLTKAQQALVMVISTIALVAVGWGGLALARTAGDAIVAKQTQDRQTRQVATTVAKTTDSAAAWIEKLRLEAEEEERDAAEDKAEAEFKAKVGDPEAAEEAREAEESAAEAAAARQAYEDAVAGKTTPPSNPAPAPAPAANGGTSYGDDIYKQEGGVVYEWDDGAWEPEYDKKIENNIVYEYDDGRWEVDDDDWDDDWDDDDWDDDDD